MSHLSNETLDDELEFSVPGVCEPNPSIAMNYKTSIANKSQIVHDLFCFFRESDRILFGRKFIESLREAIKEYEEEEKENE